jgi:hypothetical protein
MKPYNTDFRYHLFKGTSEIMLVSSCRNTKYLLNQRCNTVMGHGYEAIDAKEEGRWKK